MRGYADKRDFTKTPEPAERPKHVKRRSGALTFVIQRHNARRLHHDFRLELDGALKSWAVPKGPSLDPEVKRQAIMVEDHPLDYANFEGVIPAGEYGGGEVVIWDEGTYEPEGATGNRRKDEALVRQGLAEGKLNFEMHGSRLKGSFVLVRTKGDGWLLMKRRDEYATDEDPTADGRSVRTGRTTEDLRAGRVASETGALDRIPGARRELTPKAVEPMVAVEKPQAFESELWTWEPKLDGVRAIATKVGDHVHLASRTGGELAGRFPEIVDQIRKLSHPSIVLDGEIVLLDDEGRPSFEGLMRHYGSGRPEGKADIAFFAFDILHLDGTDLRACALADRRKVLERVGIKGDRLRLVDSFGPDGLTLYKQAAELGFEGVIGKKLSSPYRDGARSEDWVKVKGYHTEEFLVCGYTEGTGARSRTLGSLLLGRRDSHGKLRFCGGVGAGLSDEDLRELSRRLKADRISKSPFDEPVVSRTKPSYVIPKIVVEVRFMNWTKERRLRAPVFVRTRPDLAPGTWEAGANASRGGEADSVLEALASAGETLELTVEGHPIRFTSLSKQLSPGISKRELLTYYASASAAILAHLRNRPLTLVRYPDGIQGQGFFQRHFEEGLPEFAETVGIYSDSAKKAKRHLMCNNLATLLWLGQMSTIEIHPWHATTTMREDELGLGAEFATKRALEDSVLDHPDYLVCDLDPNIPGGEALGGYTPYGWAMTVEAAQALKGVLDSLRLVGFVKTTGKSGLHVYIPLRRIYNHDQAKEAARTLGRFLMDERPSLITMETRLDKRPKRVFFDANMNGRGRTLAGAYSPRPTPWGGVSTPIEWDELASIDPRNFDLRSVPARLAEKGDLWARMSEIQQTLGAP